MDIRPFKVEIPEATLNDLRERLTRTRWPDEISESGWDYGSNLSYMKELIDYWQTGFDWRAQEEAINAFAHFRATVNGLNIHFIHERGKGSRSIPLIITHGWPGSFYEMLKLIPRLTDPASHGADPADAFDVIVPSLPGYGFSDHPIDRGMAERPVADLWARLVTEGLGYARFGAHGGDWGAGVTACLGLAYPERVIGIHVTALEQPYLGPDARELSQAEQAFLKETEEWNKTEYGYGHIQRTKPQTLAYGLNDSPAGLAAWIVEKFRSWSDCAGDVEQRFTKDELLANATIYWATETINSSMRLYYEAQHNPGPFRQGERIEVPSAVALFPKDIDQPPREWAERSYNVQRWTRMPRGGHFPAMEEPELLAQDIRAFFKPLR
jgi:pimeloyl-ACP methyl ester carboxylesterase